MINREEDKHLSDVFEGKKIQWRNKILDEWIDCSDTPAFSDTLMYRIKPEAKYRPYANAAEFLNAQKEHGVYIICKRDNEKILFPIIINKRGVKMYYSEKHRFPTGYTYKDLFNYWQHQDGTPCGIKI